jgi:flagellar biosynthesis protein FlhG
MDQARTLRRLADVTKRRTLEPISGTAGKARLSHRVKVLSFTSGKGGVGKTHIVVNLAYALQLRGARVMILDADLGLANVDVLLGLTPRYNIRHVLAGEKSLAEVLVDGPAGMLILPASSGVQDLVHLTEGQRLQLLTELDTIEDRVDFLLIDTAAGISKNVMYFNLAAHNIVVVVTPEPTSITDAYALIKVLSTQYAQKHFMITMNAVANAAEAKEAFRRLHMVTERFLNVSIDYLGFVVYDASFSQAARQQKPLLTLYPSSRAAPCLHQLAQRVLVTPDMTSSTGKNQLCWKQVLTSYPQQAPDMPGR